MPDISGRFEQAYPRLHALAERYYFEARSPASTLQATDLLHEAYLRMARYPASEIEDNEHFLALAATIMRQVMIDRARQRKATKRGGDWARVTLENVALASDQAPVSLLAFDDILTRLEALDSRQAQIVELRVFAGMTVAEVAHVLEISVSTVEKAWRQARAWIRLELQRADER